MKRSFLLFKKEGLNVIASPTNHLSYEDDSYSSYFSAKNLRNCEMAIHEYLGLLYSYLRNEIWDKINPISDTIATKLQIKVFSGINKY